ncbi:hypothetical protein Taro_028976 [Colocasia esculenta]|uniref:USP domain-containing protein n=1 Tax=Colocasia esculenta TaxID=4460 RepID=A0A843VVU2_COLES|nr:hypothetical protein [Colocasia esculenta]
MLGGSGLPPLDLPALLQFGITALALVFGLLFLVRNAASRYFVVDGGFGAESGGYDGRGEMSVGEEKCFVCGRRGTKKCARCKSVCGGKLNDAFFICSSQECQAKHWKDGHKLMCKEPKLSNDFVAAGSGGKRKNPGFGSSIALIPARGSCKILEQPKKILFPYDEFVKLFNWDKQTFPPCGLLNCGNSCFANVVLQCLACTRPLAAYLLEGSHKKTCSRNDWCFLCELQDHLKKVRESVKPFSPLTILSRLPKIGGNLGNGRQEDAHEFMRFAIDTMQSICLDEFGGEKSLDASTQETTLIQYIFGGHLQSQVKCTKCDKISNRYENMMDLTVEIQGDAESLEDCLNQFTGKEWLDGENMYKCDGCNEYVKAWKRLTVHQPPNVLTIALKRFQGGRFGKLNKRVTFPETLDLRPYMSRAGDSTDLYTLYAVVVHIDMLNASFFGHYICYTKDFYGNWYRIDDCKVIKVDVEEVLAQGAYMLLYSRISVRQPFIKHPDTSKLDDEKSAEKTPASLTNPALKNTMENQIEKESLQREAEDLHLNMPLKVDAGPLVQSSGGVGLNVLHSMDLEKVQETGRDRSPGIDLDESPDSDSFKAVDGYLDPESSVPENMIDVLYEQNPSSLNEFEAKTNNVLDSVGSQLVKENGSSRALDEISNDAAKTSINVPIPALHEVVECLEANPSGPRLDVSDVTIENGLHNSFSSSEGQGLQEVLGSLCVDSMSIELEQHPSHFLTEKSSPVKEDMNIESGLDHPYERINCNQLESECENSIAKENVKPSGFLHNGIQKESSNEKTLRKSNKVDHPGRTFAVTMGKTQLNDTTSTLPYSGNNCNGLLYESEKLTSKGSRESCLSAGLPNCYAQKAPPNGKSETVSSIVGTPCKILAENGQLDFHHNNNGNQSGPSHESDKLSARGHPKPLFSRGFLDHRTERRSPEGKMQKQTGKTLPCKDNVNQMASCYPQPMRQNGGGLDENK